MESEIFNVLECLNIETNVEQKYINELVEIVKITLLPLYNKQRHKLKPSILKKFIYKFISKKFNLSDKVIQLSKIPQPEQRTKEWYEFRENRITASSAASIVNMNPYMNRDKYLQDKLGIGEKFTGNFATRHGTKFEQIATTIYEIRSDLLIFEFGSIPHLKYDFIAASPDGISNGNLPIMLEIKCPPKREIKDDYIPEYYWVQMQLQLECCNLDICHFVEIKVQFYNNSQEYYNDILSSDTLYTSDNLEKGILLKYLDEHNKNIYIYPSYNDYKNYNTLESWAKNTFNYYSTKYNTIEFKYWKITQYSLIEVNRDINWFQKTLPIFKQFWDKILYYKNNLNHFYKDIINNNKKSKTKTKTNIDNSSKLLISDSDDDNTTHTNNTSTLNNLLQPSNTNLDNSSKLLISDSDDDTENSSTLNNLLLPSNTNIDNSSKLLISDSDDDDTENTSTLNNLLLLSNTNKKNIQKNIKKNIIKQKSINKTTLINNNISTFSEISLKNTSSLITTPNNNINVNEIIDDLL